MGLTPVKKFTRRKWPRTDDRRARRQGHLGTVGPHGTVVPMTVDPSGFLPRSVGIWLCTCHSCRLLRLQVYGSLSAIQIWIVDVDEDCVCVRVSLLVWTSVCSRAASEQERASAGHTLCVSASSSWSSLSLMPSAVLHSWCSGRCPPTSWYLAFIYQSPHRGAPRGVIPYSRLRLDNSGPLIWRVQHGLLGYSGVSSKSFPPVGVIGTNLLIPEVLSFLSFQLSTTQATLAINLFMCVHWLFRCLAFPRSTLRCVGTDAITIDILLRTDASAALGVVNRRGVGKTRHIDTQELRLQNAIRNREFEV